MLILDSLWIFTNRARYSAAYGKVQGQMIKMYIPGAILAYSAMIIAFMVFIMPQIKSKKYTPFQVAYMYGAPLGFVLYSVFNGTNLAVFKDFSWNIAILDICWGTFLYFILTFIVAHALNFNFPSM
jgi:uncharacterized membrane protein